MTVAARDSEVNYDGIDAAFGDAMSIDAIMCAPAVGVARGWAPLEGYPLMRGHGRRRPEVFYNPLGRNRQRE